MNKQYGEFSRQGNEYSVSRPDTPQPWFHTLATNQAISLISQTGLGEIRLSAEPIPVTRQAPLGERPYQPSRHLYLRDNDSGEFWSLFGAGRPPEHYEVVFALDSVRFSVTRLEVTSSVTVFLPQADCAEIWQIKIQNGSSTKRRLSLFASVEWPSGISHTTFHDQALTSHPRLLADSKLVTRFIAYDHAIDSFDSFADAHWGQNHDSLTPTPVVEGRCSRSLGAGSNTVGMLQKNITLGPQTTHEGNCFVGLVSTQGKTVASAASVARSQIKRIVNRYSGTGAVESAFANVHTEQGGRIGKNLIKSPDPVADLTLNYWSKQQSLVATTNQNCSVAEQLAHLSALCATDSDQVRTRLLKLFGQQSKDGRYLAADSSSNIAPQLVATAIDYLKETADLKFLTMHVDYDDSGAASVLQHIVRAVEYSMSHLSRRHLPIINAVRSLVNSSVIESQVLACQIYRNLRELAPFLDAVGEHELTEKYDRQARRLREAINDHYWDGAWYGSQIINDKRIAGFKRLDHHKIGLAEQVWAVIAGVADAEKSKKALTSARTHLLTRQGLKSLAPSYADQTAIANSISEPGAEANGGVMLAENALAIAAWAILGDGDEAFRLFEQTCPANLASRPEQFASEPFAYPDHIYGPDHRQSGRGENCQTGLAASQIQSVFWQTILGVQPVLGGLKIDPCLPRDWRKVELTRQFRGAEYHIRILNSFRQNRGVDRILVDGLRQTGTVIPAHGNGVHFVEVVLG